MLRAFPVAASALCLLAAHAAPVEFNRDIRPILSDRCYSCHGPDKASRKSPLRLDQEANSKSDLGKGRFAIVPYEPARSEIVRRVTSANPAQRMPPAYAGKDPLSSAEIDKISRWITEGAKYQPHWSLVPPQRPALPSIADKSWPRNPVDHFILARLERHGLHPAAEADRATLLRRVTLDLTGLPPAPAELDNFLSDSAPNAYEKVVDRLLALPRYAERMTIRWLEAARYADTNGYQSDGPRDMWRWRDWVIDAFHKNMPFDQFTVEQLAGDLLPHATLSQKIATGFNRNHRTSAEGGIVDEEFRVEYVVDRVNTTASVWLGLTVGCARCHDHKYDPILQKEFYQLFAFFNNVPEKGFVYNFGNEEPYIKAPLPEQQKKLAELDRKVTDAAARVEGLEPKVQKAERGWEKQAKKTDVAWTLGDGQVYHDAGKSAATRFDGTNFITVEDKNVAKFDYKDPFTFAARIRPESAKGAILSRADDYFEGQGHALYLIDGKIRLHVIFRWTDLGMRVETVNPVKLNQWQHVLVTYDGGMKATGVHIYVDGKPQELKILFDSMIWPLNMAHPFRIGAGGGLRFQGGIDDVLVYKRALSAAEAAVVALPETVRQIAAIEPGRRTSAEQNKLRLCFLETSAPAEVTQARAALATAEGERKKYYDSIPTVMVMAERDRPRDTFVLQRGAYDAPGEKVSARVPAVLPGFRPEWPANRLGLARWLVDRSHPLTARVTVNRFWEMVFGTGLVKTLEDFGSQGEWPDNQELLDWLAVEFMDSGWNVKGMLKTLVTSAAYRQSSKVTRDLVEKDPENRLLARGPRFRLPPEMVRDQALAWSGLLVEKVGGPSVKPYQPAGLWQELSNDKGYEPDKGPGLYRRSLYSYWKRTVAPPGLAIFDSPNRETCVMAETRTNTPLQALNLMNDVIYLEASRKLAERMLKEGGTAPRNRLAYGVRLVLARTPRQGEVDVLEGALSKFAAYYDSHAAEAVRFVSHGDSPPDPQLQAGELAAYSAVASLLMNMDEAITKE